MIQHKINKERRTVYEEEIHIKKETIDRIVCCLNAEDLSKMTDVQRDAWKYEMDANELIFDVDFDDGCSITWRLCSGQHNYYDEVVFWFEDDSFIELDCTYEIDDIEIEVDNKIYRVKLVIE